jgi:hypothetical protein
MLQLGWLQTRCCETAMHSILLHVDHVVEQAEIHPRHTVVIYEYAVAKALVPFDFIACV